MPTAGLPRARPPALLLGLLVVLAVLVLGRVAGAGPSIATLIAVAAVGAALVLSLAWWRAP